MHVCSGFSCRGILSLMSFNDNGISVAASGRISVEFQCCPRRSPKQFQGFLILKTKSSVVERSSQIQSGQKGRDLANIVEGWSCSAPWPKFPKFYLAVWVYMRLF